MFREPAIHPQRRSLGITCGATSSMASAGTSFWTTISLMMGLGAKWKWLSASSLVNRVFSKTRHSSLVFSSLSSTALPVLALTKSSAYSSPRPCSNKRLFEEFSIVRNLISLNTMSWCNLQWVKCNKSPQDLGRPLSVLCMAQVSRSWMPLGGEVCPMRIFLPRCQMPVLLDFQGLADGSPLCQTYWYRAPDLAQMDYKDRWGRFGHIARSMQR